MASASNLAYFPEPVEKTNPKLKPLRRLSRRTNRVARYLAACGGATEWDGFTRLTHSEHAARMNRNLFSGERRMTARTYQKAVLELDRHWLLTWRSANRRADRRNPRTKGRAYRLNLDEWNRLTHSDEVEASYQEEVVKKRGTLEPRMGTVEPHGDDEVLCRENVAEKKGTVEPSAQRGTVEPSKEARCVHEKGTVEPRRGTVEPHTKDLEGSKRGSSEGSDLARSREPRETIDSLGHPGEETLDSLRSKIRWRSDRDEIEFDTGWKRWINKRVWNTIESESLNVEWGSLDYQLSIGNMNQRLLIDARLRGKALHKFCENWILGDVRRKAARLRSCGTLATDEDQRAGVKWVGTIGGVAEDTVCDAILNLREMRTESGKYSHQQKQLSASILFHMSKLDLDDVLESCERFAEMDQHRKPWPYLRAMLGASS